MKSILTMINTQYYNSGTMNDWDASNGYNFADTVAPYLAALP